jgi:hypothetical protein
MMMKRTIKPFLWEKMCGLDVPLASTHAETMMNLDYADCSHNLLLRFESF